MRFWNLLIDRLDLVKILKTLPKFGETWTWWKPGEFTRFSLNKNKAFYTSKIHQKKCFSVFVCVFLRFTVKFGLNLVKFQNLVKTWWEIGEFPELGEYLVHFQKTWWIPKPGKRRGEFQKTWWAWWLFWKRGENLVNLQNLVKTRWMPKPGVNLVITWWTHQVFSTCCSPRPK